MATTLSKKSQEEIETLLDEKLEPLNFQSLVRMLPKIGEKMDGTYEEAVWHAKQMLTRYMSSPTEPEGMADVERYLDEILK